MITGELKNKVDGIWDIFWAGGLTNPLDVIEQITYLMFIHDLDESDTRRAKESAMLGLPFQSIFAKEVTIGERTVDGEQLKWSVFRDFPADRMYSVVQEWVFPFIKELHGNKDSAYSKYMGDAIFKVPTPLMCRLYEKFILEYYRKEFPELKANPSQISWALDDGNDEMLPVMQSDIMLTQGGRVLIIDAKYYSSVSQVQYDKRTVQSNNLYQIFTYVKNKEVELADTQHEVSGMLLYAQTDEEVQPSNTYQMSGNQISVETLNLNCDFSQIADQLNAIAVDFFKESA